MNHYCKRMRNWKEDKKPHQKKSRRYNRIAFIAITKWICAGSVRKFLSNESTIIRTPNLKNQRSRLLGTALCIAKCWKVDLNIQTYCTNSVPRSSAIFLVTSETAWLISAAACEHHKEPVLISTRGCRRC